MVSPDRLSPDRPGQAPRTGANAMLRDRIEEVCEQEGLRPPKICTPEELLETSHE